MKSCQHSTLPVKIKRAFVFDYMETILVCSLFTQEGNSEVENDRMRCFEWKDTSHTWEELEIPESNDRTMSAVQILG